MIQSIQTINKCPKCGGTFDSGEISEVSELSTNAATWAKKAGSFLFIGSKDSRKLIANRCTSCGYIELYSQ